MQNDAMGWPLAFRAMEANAAGMKMDAPVARPSTPSILLVALVTLTIATKVT